MAVCILIATPLCLVALPQKLHRILYATCPFEIWASLFLSSVRLNGFR